MLESVKTRERTLGPGSDVVAKSKSTVVLFHHVRRETCA